MEKNASEDLVAIKDFLDRILKERAHRVNTLWLDSVQTKKGSNESDDIFVRQFNTLKTQIEDEAKDLAKIEVMHFYAELDEPMQRKICKQSSMPEIKHDLVALPKKLRPNLDCEPKPSSPMCTYPTPSTSTQPERSDALVASSSYENSHRK